MSEIKGRRGIQELNQGTVEKLKQAQADSQAAASSYQMVILLLAGAVVFDLVRRSRKGK